MNEELSKRFARFERIRIDEHKNQLDGTMIGSWPPGENEKSGNVWSGKSWRCESRKS